MTQPPDLTRQQLGTWLAATYPGEIFGQILETEWAFLAIKGQVTYGGNAQSVTLAVVKRTGEVWYLLPGWQVDAASYATTEADFRAQVSSLQPIARIPR